jgi:CDI toxin RNase A-like protein
MLLLAVAGCRRPAATQAEAEARTAPAINQTAPREPSKPRPGLPTRDLSIDESKGGHTLARHVGKTDAELRDRLRREQISSASTYTDRAAAEHAVGAALAAGSRTLDAWQNRSGRRPNLVLHYRSPDHEPIGRSLTRSQEVAVPAVRALVVLRWDERAGDFYVLTSYPEAER